MRIATLVSWLLTVGLGSFMLRTWLTRGGLHQARTSPGGLPPALIFGHAAAALVGLLLWAAYLVAGARSLAWAAVGALMVAVALGLCTVTLWTPYPARRPGERRPGERRSGEELPGRQRLDAPWDLDAPGDKAAEEAAADDRYQVTDEMIARLLTEPFPGGRRSSVPGKIRPNPAVLVPLAHGFGAIATFVLAVMSAIT